MMKTEISIYEEFLSEESKRADRDSCQGRRATEARRRRNIKKGASNSGGMHKRRNKHWSW